MAIPQVAAYIGELCPAHGPSPILYKSTDGIPASWAGMEFHPYLPIYSIHEICRDDYGTSKNIRRSIGTLLYYTVTRCIHTCMPPDLYTYTGGRSVRVCWCTQVKVRALPPNCTEDTEGKRCVR